MTMCKKPGKASILAFGALMALAWQPPAFGQSAQNAPLNITSADNAGNDQHDIDSMQRIRRAVVTDNRLSIDAQNIKIISRQGVVTLEGPVRSLQESKTVEAKAVGIAGSGNVVNDLTVNPNGTNQSNP